MAKKIPTMSSLNLENSFLNYLIDKKIPVKIFLKNGLALVGYINNFDAEVISLSSHQHSHQIVYKANIATVFPIEKEEI